MMKIKSKQAFNKFVYVTTIGVAVTAILFITGKMFSRVELSNTVQSKQSIDITNIKIASTKKNSFNVISRSSAEIRTSANEEQIKEAQKEETKKGDTQQEKAESTESKKVTTSTKKNTSSENKSTKSSSTKTKTTESSSKKTTTKSSESKNATTTEKENKKSTTTTTSISKVQISKTMDLTKRTGLSREDFIKLISGVKADTSGFFEDNAGKIYDLCKKYSINEIFFCGLISAESGWNIASNHRRTHNYISLMKNGKLISYGSVNEGLEVAAQKLHYNYLTPGGKFYHGKTLAGVKTCFCPSGTWVNLVYGRMKQIV